MPRLLPLSRAGWVPLLGLTLLLIYAATVRIQGAAHALPYVHHWDEPLMFNTSLGMLKSGSIAPKDGGYEGNSYNYGGLTQYACLAIDWLHYGWLKLTSADAPTTRAHIETNLNGNYRTLSHPSFLLWNRYYVIALSLVLIAAVYALGAQLINPWGGWFAALLCTLSTELLRQSVILTVDLPMVTYAVLCTYFSLRYAREGTARMRLWAFITCAAAIATKYTAGLLILSPLMAHGLVLQREGKLSWKRIVGAGFTIFGFWLIVNPFALIDIEGFGFMLRAQFGIYNEDPSIDSISPGLPHLLYQAEQIAADLFPLLFVFSLAGLLTLIWLRRAQLAELAVWLPYPVLTIGILAQTSLRFPRNFLVAYPFLAICASVLPGLLLAGLWRTQVPALSSAWGSRWPKLAAIALMMLGLALGAPLWQRQSSAVAQLQPGTDTRSRAIELANRRLATAPADARVAVVSEVYPHRLDLARLSHPADVIYHRQLPAALKQYDLVIASRYRSLEPALHPDDAALNAALAQAWPHVVDSLPGQLTHRDQLTGYGSTPVNNPQLYFLASSGPRQPLSSFAQSDTLVIDVRSLRRTWVAPMIDGATLAIDWEMTLSTLPLYFPHGRYQLVIDADAEVKDGTPGSIDVALGDAPLHHDTLPPTRTTLTIPFEVVKAAHAPLHLAVYRALPISREKVNAHLSRYWIVRIPGR